MKKILVVDDDVDFLNILASVLSKNACVTKADNLSDALTLLQTEAFDVICSDLHLRNGNGMDILTFVNHSKLDIPVFIISGTEDRFFINEVERLGGKFYSKTNTEFLSEINVTT